MKSNQLKNILKYAQWFYDVQVIINDKEIKNISFLAITKENNLTLKIVDSNLRFIVNHINEELKYNKENCKVSIEYNNQTYDNFNLVIDSKTYRVLVIC